MAMRIAAYQHGIYPRSERVVAATRDLERGRTTQEAVEERFAADLRDLVAVQREAGLDYFSDGLLRWQDIFRPLVEACPGMEARALVRWFDNNAFFRAPEFAGSPSIEGELPSAFAGEAQVPSPRVATLPSPYMFSRAAHTAEDRDKVMVELARGVLRPVADALSARGYEVIHLQEPWLAYFGMDSHAWDGFEQALEEIREGLNGRSTLVLHTYFGDAAPYADRLRTLPVDAVGVDFVETDLDALGTGWQVGVVAGCMDGRRSLLEEAETTARFAARVAETLQPASLYLSSNSDLEFLPQPVAREKVLRLGEAAGRLKEWLA